MTRFLGESALIPAVVAKLQQEMPARVADINLRHDDAIVIAAVPASRYFTAALRILPPPGPAIQVVEGPTRIDPRGEGPHTLSTVTQINVWVLEEDMDEQTLAEKLRRQKSAVIEALWDGDPKEQLNNLDGSLLAWKLVPTGTVPGTAYEPDRGGPSLRQYTLVQFAASRYEE